MSGFRRFNEIIDRFDSFKKLGADDNICHGRVEKRVSVTISQLFAFQSIGPNFRTRSIDF